MDYVAEIKSRVDIVELLSGYLELKKAGRNFKACCPFHQEKTPSFIISPERQFAWCFGCQTGGDIFKMVEHLEGVDFRGALQILAEKAGVTLPEYSGAAGERKEKKDRLLEINEKAAQFFAARLTEDDGARRYLEGRGLSVETIAAWQIGYAPDGFENLTPELLEAGYEKKELVEAGVASTKEMADDRIFDRFRGRVMFPIADSRGRVVAFTGRVLGDGEPKYLNSAESPIFSKSQILFGLEKARDSIRERGYAAVCEGQMDVIATHQAGFTNFVASSGTALTEQHLSQLSKITDRVVFCFDADTAGIDSTKRAIELALLQDFTVQICQLPEGSKDPDDAIKSSREEFVKSLENPLSVFDFYFFVVYREADLTDPTTKKKIARQLIGVARHFASAIEKEEFVKSLSLKLQVSEAALREEARQLGGSSPRQKSVSGEVEAAPTPERFSREDYLLGFLLAFPELAKSHIETLQKVSWSRPENLRIFEKLSTSNFIVATAIAELDDEGSRLHAEKMELFASEKCETFSEDVLKKEFDFLLAEIQKSGTKKNKQQLLAELAAAEAAGDAARAAEILAEYQAMS